MLAAMDNNNNVGREQATVKTGPRKGESRYNIVRPKGRKGWVVKPVYKEKNYGYVTKLMTAVKELCKSGGEGALEMPTRDLPPNIAPEERPPKEDVLKVHRSRFEKE